MPRRDTIAKRTGKKGGRPSALTPQRADLLVAAIRRGNHINTACHLAGVSTAAFYRWMERADKADYAIDHGYEWDPAEQVYREFRERVLRARAETADMMVDVVHRAAIGGQLVSEEPAVDSKGDPIRDEDGRVIMKRQWTTPDGRLALAYLKVAQPGEWAGTDRLDVTSGGKPLGAGSGEPDGDAVNRLASRLREAIEERKAIEAGERDPGNGEAVPDAEGVYDAEVVDE